MLESLDTIFRFGGVFACVLIAALAMRDARCSLASHLAAMLSVCTIAFLVVSARGTVEQIGLGVIPLEALALGSPVALWLFSLALFDDNFRLSPTHIGVAALFWLSSMAIFPHYYLEYGRLEALAPHQMHAAVSGRGVIFAVLEIASDVIKLGLVAHMLLVAWRGREDDLLESRRKFRATFVVGGAMIMMVVIYYFSFAGPMANTGIQPVELLLSGSVFFITNYLLWNIIRIDSEWLLGDLSEVMPAQTPVQAEPADAYDLARLNDLAGNATLLEQGLTISRLAEIAGMPEHRLRRLINQHMGFRNFADFLNHHRITEAKSRLANANDRHIPVLTIAMDLGYGSLGPFNRAFKERTGQTPTEFRNASLSSDLVAAQ